MSDQLPNQLPPEEEELQKILRKIHSYPKLNKWVVLFLDASNKETWGNRTASALIAYNLSREDPKQYAVAMSIGFQNFRKLKNIASEFIEKQGWTAGKQLELLTAKAVDTNNAKYMQMLLEITGVYDPKATVQIQNNTQINNTAVQISSEEEQQLNKEFAEFIEAKYRGKPAMNPDGVQSPQSG